MTRAPRAARSKLLQQLARRQRRRPPSRARMKTWKTLERTVALLAALSAIAVVGFTWKSIKQVNSEQAITREGQITDRYMAAVELLGNKDSEDVRLGGIYGLQRVMQDSPRDQPTVINVISAFIRAHGKKPETGTGQKSVTSDIAEATAVLKSRDSRNDGAVHIDLHDADVHGVTLDHADLNHSDLSRADLSWADLRFTNLSHAKLSKANLSNAAMLFANLSDAELPFANMSNASLVRANLTEANLNFTNLSTADLSWANLSWADVSWANLSNANLSNADLSHATMMRTDLRHSDLTNAALPNTLLLYVELACAKLDGANLQGAAVRLDQVLSAEIDEATKLPQQLANDPQVKKKAYSGARPRECEG
ncbi:pentapeptide repeat-containing protein [Streptomyces sp. MZ04]|uniref:pentapeptide repeat-containing protein n=1 Tax=Streptomyces sp. MZ04 TaxID=2559236 RepID=UPI00107EB2EF|nr:pentapeptide repeat-containing protein [Streptomyces sp. MZ04]TGB16037.1 pentapeptide repeat-containing protein [Streptomyces sp. MZ04]